MVAAAILAAVEGGILPPGKNGRLSGDLQIAARFGLCVDLEVRARRRSRPTWFMAHDAVGNAHGDGANTVFTFSKKKSGSELCNPLQNRKVISL